MIAPSFLNINNRTYPLVGFGEAGCLHQRVPGASPKSPFWAGGRAPCGRRQPAAQRMASWRASALGHPLGDLPTIADRVGPVNNDLVRRQARAAALSGRCGSYDAGAAKAA